MDPHWQYKVVWVVRERTRDPNHTAIMYEQEINNWKGEGWEVVTALGSEDNTTYLLLRRPAPVTPPAFAPPQG